MFDILCMMENIA